MRVITNSWHLCSASLPYQTAFYNVWLMHSNNLSFLIILKFIDSRLWLRGRAGNCYKCIWKWPIKRNVLPYFHQRKGCGSHGKVKMADTFYVERNRPFVHEWPKGWWICCLVFPHLCCCCLETDLAGSEDAGNHVLWTDVF